MSRDRTPDTSLVPRSRIQKKATQMSGFFVPVGKDELSYKEAQERYGTQG